MREMSEDEEAPSSCIHHQLVVLIWLLEDAFSAPWQSSRALGVYLSRRSHPPLHLRILCLRPHPTVLPHPHQYSANARPRSYGARNRHWTDTVSRRRKLALMYDVGRRRPAASPCPAHNTLLPPLLLRGPRLPPEPCRLPEGVVTPEWVSVIGGHISACRRIQLMMMRLHASWRMTWRMNRLSELGLALEYMRA
jgi:hypothetical protein